MNGIKSGSSQLSEILKEMNTDGGFAVSVLTDQHGFPIASAAQNSEEAETQSAVVALVQKTISQAANQVGIGQMDEIRFFDNQGRLLVCRSFDANGHRLILAFSTDDRRQPYRRLTNQVIRKIRQVWKL